MVQTKKLLASVLLVAATIHLFGCGGGSPNAANQDVVRGEQTPRNSTAPEHQMPANEESKKELGSGAGPRSLGVGEKLAVMASTLHLAQIALDIAGEDARVEMLPHEGGDPHSFEVMPDDRRQIEHAHLLLINGFSLETFDAARLANDARVTLVNCSAEVPEKFLLEGEPDPHIWLSTEGASLQGKAIAESMAKADSTHAEDYRKRAREFVARLEKLREDFKARIAALPSKSLITDHDAFAYFAREFGLKYVGYLCKLPSMNPTLQERRALEKSIKESGARAIFAEPGHDGAASEAVAKSAGVKLARLDPIEIGKPAKGGYEATMKRNLEAVIDALK